LQASLLSSNRENDLDEEVARDEFGHKLSVKLERSIRASGHKPSHPVSLFVVITDPNDDDHGTDTHQHERP
jgi:hypothetical protein